MTFDFSVVVTYFKILTKKIKNDLIFLVQPSIKFKMCNKISSLLEAHFWVHFVTVHIERKIACRRKLY